MPAPARLHLGAWSYSVITNRCCQLETTLSAAFIIGIPADIRCIVTKCNMPHRIIPIMMPLRAGDNTSHAQQCRLAAQTIRALQAEAKPI